MKKKIIIVILTLYTFSTFLINSANHIYSVNIRANSYGIDPNLYKGTYNDIIQHVILLPRNGDNRYLKTIPRVYVRRLISDPPGHNFIGTIPNPLFNPGFITESTSYRPIFEIYATKY